MRNEALANDGLTPSLDNGDYDLLLWDTTRYTNWIKKLIGGTSKYNDIQASFSGGNNNTQFIISGGFHRETPVIPGNFEDLKGSFHFNLTNVSNNQKFRIQLTTNYLIDDNSLPATDPTNYAITLPPDAPAIKNVDGSLNWAPGPSGFTSWSNGNPLAFLLQTYSSKTNNLVSNALMSYTIIPGLEIKSSFGYTNMQSDETNQFPATSVDPAYLPLYGNSTRAAFYGNNNIHSWIIEPQISYNKSIGKGVLNFLLGGTFNQVTSNGTVLSGVGYSSDQQLGSILAASTISVQSAVNSVYKYEALFGRINYNWADKYLINLTMRRDGSSRFGPASQFHNFGAGGLAWIFSKEQFSQNLLKPLSFGKIRISYGTTGSDQIGDYTFMDLYSSSAPTAPYQGVSSSQLNNLYNPNLSWEETKKFEVGVELGFLKDNILLQATYYKNRSSNELVNANLPFVTGFQSVRENLPAVVENQGWELVINTKNISSKNFSWTTSFNLTVGKNTLASVSSGMSSYYHKLVGHPLNSAFVYHFLGVNDTTGIYQFASKAGPTSNPSVNDQTVNVNLNPKYYGGLLNSFKYKSFQLDFLFQFVKQIGPNYLFGDLPGNQGINQPKTVLNRWQNPADNTNIQKYNSDQSLARQFSYAQTSDGYYTDASFIRLKNLSFSYQLPSGFLLKAHIQNARIYVLCQNLLTITHYIGVDPENKNVYAMPPLKVTTIGIQVSL
jgi:TonB-linked SusC/RagA family outer membrane protein